MRLNEITTLLALVGMAGVANARVIVEDFLDMNGLNGQFDPELFYNFGTSTDFSGLNDLNDLDPGTLWLFPDRVRIDVISLATWEYIESVQVTWTSWDGQLGRTALEIFGATTSASVTDSILDVPETVSLSVLDLGGENIEYFTIEGFEMQIHEIIVTIVPSPSSVALLGFGGLIAVRRRR